MGLFINPLGHAGYPPNVTGTPYVQPSEVRAATAAEVTAGTINYAYVSPATASSLDAGLFASPPVLGSTTPNVVHATDIYGNLTTNGLVYGAGTNGKLVTTTPANNAVVTTGTSGIPTETALANGQVIVGQGSASAPAAVYQSNQQNTFVGKFTNIPSMSASTGGVAAVTINTYNIWSVPQWGAAFECYNTTASTAIAPSMSTTAGNGLNIDTITGATSKTIEITEGNTVNSKNAFVIGTSPSFFVKVGFNISTLANVVSLTMGFRKVQIPYQATLLTGYSDYACIGVQNSVANGEIQIQTQVGSGGETKTDTAKTATAATTFTVQVNVSATGVVTYLFNGTAAMASPPAYTFTSALTVIPFIVYTTAAGAHAEVDLVSYQCGFQ